MTNKVELLKSVTNRGLEYWKESYVEEFYNSYKLLEAIKEQFGVEVITKLFNLVNSETSELMQILRHLEENNVIEEEDENEEYTELYLYLEKLYNKSELRASYSLDNFMYEWIYSNIANEAEYQTEFNDDYLGVHYRTFQIDHNKKCINFYIADED